MSESGRNLVTNRFAAHGRLCRCTAPQVIDQGSGNRQIFYLPFFYRLIVSLSVRKVVYTDDRADRGESFNGGG
jgi:hypothetical protein